MAADGVEIVVSSRDNIAGELTRNRILDAAGALFDEHGFEGVSLRSVTGRADVNSAAVHYHFGSKEEVLAALFQRGARPIVHRRLKLLRQMRRGGDGRALVEDILEAFLRPGIEVGHRKNASFARLRAKLALERRGAIRNILSQAFDETSAEFVAALAEALPDLPRDELYWRFHFLLGAMVYTMADPGRIQSLSDGICDPSDTDQALRRMIAFFAGAFRMPAGNRSDMNSPTSLNSGQKRRQT